MDKIMINIWIKIMREGEGENSRTLKNEDTITTPSFAPNKTAWRGEKKPRLTWMNCNSMAYRTWLIVCSLPSLSDGPQWNIIEWKLYVSVKGPPLMKGCARPHQVPHTMTIIKALSFTLRYITLFRGFVRIYRIGYLWTYTRISIVCHDHWAGYSIVTDPFDIIVFPDRNGRGDIDRRLIVTSTLWIKHLPGMRSIVSRISKWKDRRLTFFFDDRASWKDVGPLQQFAGQQRFVVHKV